MNKPLLFIIIVLFINPIFSKDYKDITLEKIWLERTFSQKSVYGLKSMKDGEHYTVLESVDGQQQINKYTYEKGIMAGNILKNDLKDEDGNKIRIESYTFSNNEDLILIRTNSERIYRHSMRSSYFVYNLESKGLTRIGEGKFQLAQLSPNGKHISYVKENNIFLFDLESKKEIQISLDGKKNEIINGAPDWVYEEEFALVSAYSWSPDSKYLAYYRFDEKAVMEYSFPFYGTLYPENYVYKYPKVGEKNSEVGIMIYNLNKGNTMPVLIQDEFEYIPRIAWTQHDIYLSIQTMNRKQNLVTLFFSNPTTGITMPVFGESSDTYLEVQDIHFLKSRSAFLWQSENQAGYNQVFLHEIQKIDPSESDIEATFKVHSGKLLSGEGNIVTDIIGFDEKNMTLFYEHTDMDHPIERMSSFFRIADHINLTIPLIEGTGRVVPSKHFKYFISYNSSSKKPLEVKVHNSEGFPIRIIEDNKVLIDTLKEYNVSYKEFFKFQTKDSVELQGWMIKPFNFNSDNKYPVLMYVYGGPGSQTVRNSWGGSNEWWFRYLSSKGYIVVSVDNRGTGARGRAFRTSTYGQLGNLETQDQISAASYMGSLDYVDDKRIGIWGWSYGGYMSTLCLAKGNDIFKMAMAVAPVSNWKYYDNIYTERYMGLIDENGDSYDENSPINHVDKIKGKFLLVHGTADDNVHFQNTTELIDALVKNDIQFDLAIYPDKNHGIYGGNTRYHLYTKMSDFILENL